MNQEGAVLRGKRNKTGDKGTEKEGVGKEKGRRIEIITFKAGWLHFFQGSEQNENVDPLLKTQEKSATKILK